MSLKSKTLAVYRGVLGAMKSKMFPAPKFTPAAYPTAKEKIDFLDAHMSHVIPQQMYQHGIVGLTVGVVIKDELVWSKGYGLADKETKTPMSTETLFEIGSVTKVFTATAIMQLVERGLMKLEDPVVKYIPEFRVKIPKRWRDIVSMEDITVASLLRHLSGLPSDYLKGMWSANPTSFNEVVSLLQDQALTMPPNTMHSYSNVAFSLLGVVIERVSELGYEDFLRNNIYNPLNMTNSAFMNNSEDTTSGKLFKSSGYQDEWSPAIPSFNTKLRDIPAGGIVSNIVDMSKFCAAFLQPFRSPILKPETISMMMDVNNLQSPKFPLDDSFGITWVRNKLLHKQCALHDGQTLQHSSFFALFPDSEMGVIALSNTRSDIHTHIALKAAKVVHETKLAEPSRSEETDNQENSKFPVNGLDHCEEEFVGKYASTDGIVEVTKDKEGRNLILQMQGRQFQVRKDKKMKIPGSSLEFSSYFLKAKPLFGFINLAILQLPYNLWLYQDEDAKLSVPAQYLVFYHRQGGSFICPKILPNTLSKSQIVAWKEYAGTYCVEDTSRDLAFISSLELSIDEISNSITVTVSVQFLGETTKSSYFLVPVDEDNECELMLAGIGRGLGITLLALPTQRIKAFGFIFSKIHHRERL